MLGESCRFLKVELKLSKERLAGTYEAMERNIQASVTMHTNLRMRLDEDARVAQEIRDMRLELARLRALHPPQQVQIPIQPSDNLELKVFLDSV